uniref:Uncharacterized protein n=1 Tax=Oryza rufipogon TaxID=4529 RepID=A0A0E0PMJ3_ORYRU
MLHGRKCVSRLAAGGVVEASLATTVERPASYLRQLAVFQTSRSLALLARNVHNHCCSTWPNGLLNVRRIYVFSPHAYLATKNQLLLCRVLDISQWFIHIKSIPCNFQVI